MLVGPRFAKAHQSTNGGGRGVKDGDAIAFNDLPPAVGIGEGGSAFKQHGGHPRDHGTIHEVGMTRDPAGVSRTPPAIHVIDIEGVLQS